MTGGSFPAQYQLRLWGGQRRLQRLSRGGGREEKEERRRRRKGGGGRKEEKEEERRRKKGGGGRKEVAPVGDDEAKCYRGLERSHNKRRELLEDSPRLTGFIQCFAAGWGHESCSRGFVSRWVRHPSSATRSQRCPFIMGAVGFKHSFV